LRNIEALKMEAGRNKIPLAYPQWESGLKHLLRQSCLVVLSFTVVILLFGHFRDRLSLGGNHRVPMY
jgi:hypothetical protein